VDPQGHRGARTRNEGRVRRLEALRRERAARRERIGHVNFDLGEGERSGKLVAELQHVSKSFGNRCVIADFSCVIQRGDKVGLIGPNGCGKTTLLKLLLENCNRMQVRCGAAPSSRLPISTSSARSSMTMPHSSR